MMTDIAIVEEKYGLALFRTALTHLVDVGHRNLTDENVGDSIKQIIAQAKADMANGKKPLMAPEFQCDIVRCAAELSKFSIWELFAYIKENVVIGAESDGER
jgi:hypothetical protein